MTKSPVIPYLVAILGIIVLWYIVSSLIGNNLLPGPFPTFIRLGQEMGHISFWRHIQSSVYRILRAGMCLFHCCSSGVAAREQPPSRQTLCAVDLFNLSYTQDRFPADNFTLLWFGRCRENYIDYYYYILSIAHYNQGFCPTSGDRDDLRV